MAEETANVPAKAEGHEALGKRAEEALSDAFCRNVAVPVQPIWTRKHVSGWKVHQRMGAVMRWAIVQGYRTDKRAGTDHGGAAAAAGAGSRSTGAAPRRVGRSHRGGPEL